jgi:CRP-like cAMP-binding protein/multidrug resistance efflux pump
VATGDFFAYLGSILIFASFYMTTMIKLRVVAILGNCTFIIYGLLEGILPIILLDGALLPLNILRLQQTRRVIAQTKSDSRDGVSIEVLYPFMTPVRFQKDEVLFRKGESSSEMFYILDGVVRLDEFGGKNLGSGEMLGEISMFSPSKDRTSTAVAVTDVDLMRMTRDQVLQLYHQSPRFGFYLVQLITGRLIENYTALEASIRGTAMSESTPDDLPSLAKSQEPSNEVPAISDSGPKTARASSRRLRWAALGLLFLMTLFLGWNAAPYVRSVITRDAVVTTWTNVATSPIRGQVAGPLPAPGERLGTDGRIVTVRDFQADEGSAARSAAEVRRLGAEIAMLEAHVSELERIDESLAARAREHADVFKKNLEIEIDGVRRELSSIDDQLDLARAEAGRKSTLLKEGTGAASAVDRAMAEVRELERVRSELEKEVASAQQRRRAVEHGVFITSSGDDPDWAYDNRESMRLEIEHAKHAMADMRIRLIEARANGEVARDLLKRRSVAEVTVPPGSLVWSVFIDADATVAAGQPLLAWIDCRVLLVDVPVSDMELALLQQGTMAEVILEGEKQVRKGIVMLVRGSASTLDRADLVAVTNDRTGSDGQVLLSIDLSDLPGCPVGRKASVEFPESSLLGILRSRLRL